VDRANPAGRIRDDDPDIPGAPAWFIATSRREVAKTCGSCRNWFASGTPGGRGVCDHPGSGFMYPYSDTAACPFHDGR